MLDRDRGCIFCKRRLFMDKLDRGGMVMLDAMHVVNKSQNGLGVIENGVIGCRGHHHMMDNSEHGPKMREYAKEYLQMLYPGWTEEMVTYSKWKSFKHNK